MIPRSLVEGVIGRWKADGSAPGAPRPSQEVKAFETKYSVTLPPDVRAFLGTADGMAGNARNDHDNEGFSFWPLGRWTPVVEEPAASEGLVDVETLRGLFVFADYMTWSWAYAVGLDLHRPQYGSVLLVGDGSPYTVADSFFDFLDKYLTRPDELFKR